jgi:hypothetical protein
MVVPADLREIIGQSIFKVPTGHTDEHQAATVAAPIIADLQARIRSAREVGKRLEQVTAENLAERYGTERLSDPERAEITRITDVINFVLASQRHAWADHAKQVRSAGYDVHAALRRLPGGDAAAEAADHITGHATPLLTYLERWKPDAGLKPRPLDQATSSIKQFDKAVAKPIERIEQRRAAVDRRVDQRRWRVRTELEDRQPQAGRNSQLLVMAPISPDCPRRSESVCRTPGHKSYKPEKREGGTSSTVSRGRRGSLLDGC